MARTGIVFALLCIAWRLPSAGADSPFAVVMIDEETERKHGAFPLDRALVADAIKRINECQPRGIVLKFILDLPRKPAGDARLAEALGGAPVLLEARFDPKEKKPNPLPGAFFLKERPPAGDRSIAGESGWIPLPLFAAKARDIGFVDVSSGAKAPILERYRGQYVKALLLCTLEMALEAKAEVFPGKNLVIRGRSVPIDDENQLTIDFPARDELGYLPFHDVLSGALDPAKLKGKVVILGYDGPKMPSLTTPIGQVKGQRVFIYALESLYRKATG